MKLAQFQESDLDELREIHKRDYPNDNFPDFDRILNPMVIRDNTNERIISAGGIELIAEGVLVTNKQTSEFARGRALEIQLGLMSASCHSFGLVDLHAFVINNLDEIWIRALKHYGFQSAGNAFFKRIL